MNPYKQILMNSHASESDNFKKSDRELLDELRLALCKQLNIADVRGMFSEKQMEEAWTDGCGCGESRSGFFDIENYR